jgi:hypothetical protein
MLHFMIRRDYNDIGIIMAAFEAAAAAGHLSNTIITTNTTNTIVNKFTTVAISVTVSHWDTACRTAMIKNVLALLGCWGVLFFLFGAISNSASKYPK